MKEPVKMNNIMKLNKIHVRLHQMGFDTKTYKKYVKRLQDRLNYNWFAYHASDYWMYWHKCKVDNFDFTGEYDEAILVGHMTPQEAYDYVFEEFINK